MTPERVAADEALEKTFMIRYEEALEVAVAKDTLDQAVEYIRGWVDRDWKRQHYSIAERDRFELKACIRVREWRKSRVAAVDERARALHQAIANALCEPTLERAVEHVEAWVRTARGDWNVALLTEMATAVRERWPHRYGAQDPLEPQKPPTHNTNPALWDLVVSDMQKRDRFGREKYGTPLQAHNGRDALADAYQEALDMAVYLRQAIFERDGH